MRDERADLEESGLTWPREAVMTTVLDVLRDLRWLSSGRQAFRGAAFVGGFSYADTLDSAKGWGPER